MAKENAFLKNAREKDLIDDQEIAVVADITCNNGNSGRGWMFLNGSTLHLYAMAGFADLGEHIESIDLKNAQVRKSSSFVLHPYMVLQCGDFIWHFQGFAQAKRVIEAVKASCGQ